MKTVSIITALTTSPPKPLKARIINFLGLATTQDLKDVRKDAAAAVRHAYRKVDELATHMGYEKIDIDGKTYYIKND